MPLPVSELTVTVLVPTLRMPFTVVAPRFTPPVTHMAVNVPLDPIVVADDMLKELSAIFPPLLPRKTVPKVTFNDVPLTSMDEVVLSLKVKFPAPDLEMAPKFAEREPVPLDRIRMLVDAETVRDAKGLARLLVRFNVKTVDVDVMDAVSPTPLPGDPEATPHVVGALQVDPVE